MYPDESSKQGVWRVLPATDFSAWLKAQSRVPSSIRYIVDHHAYSPSYTIQNPAGFKQQVLNIFRNYYEPQLGWGRDRGPQLFLGLIDDEPWVVIAANLWVHGPHCANFNACSVGIETMWNGDRCSWTEPMLRGLYLIHGAFRDRLGIPLKRGVSGPVNTNLPTTSGKGWLFHRDAKNSNKSCPGVMNAPTALQAAFDRYDKEAAMLTKEQETLLKQLRVSNIARSYDAEILKLLAEELLEDMSAVDKLEAKKAAAVAAEKRRLGL